MARVQYLLLLLTAICLLKGTWTASVGETCTIESTPGICKPASDCLQLSESIKRGDLALEGIACGTATAENIICCPTAAFSKAWILKRLRPGLVRTATEKSTTERPAEQACRSIEEKIIANPAKQLLVETGVEPGDFPYMVGIGYKNNPKQTTYDIQCGGTLIDAKFVLTAAHCISLSDTPPLIVRLGVINNTDTEQLKNGLEIPIKKMHVHPENNQKTIYNDIALLELESSVEFTPNINPICLYTSAEDPSADSQLYTTGWSLTGKDPMPSDVLVKGVEKLVPSNVCDTTYRKTGHTQSVSEGIIKSQICTEPMETRKDPCQGDDGGPLSLVVEPTWRIHRLLGIISVSYDCSFKFPGVNTRVASYLDFIEEIVWPHLK